MIYQYMANSKYTSLKQVGGCRSDSFFLTLLIVTNTLNLYICARLFVSNYFCILYKNHYENAN